MARRAVPTSCALVLPSVGRGIPFRFEYNPDSTKVATFARTLAAAGILQDQHWRGKATLQDACEKALAELATLFRPRPRAHLGLSVMDSDDIHISVERYAEKYRIKPSDVVAPLQGIVVTQAIFDHVMKVEVIGQALETLEGWPRVGQTVLDVLERGLFYTTGCLGPTTGVQWASHAYWQGEEDESYYIQDELANVRDEITQQCKRDGKPVPDDATIIKEHLEIFTRAEYDKAIPRKWQCKYGRQPLPFREWPLVLEGLPNKPDSCLVEVFGWQMLRDRWPAIHEQMVLIQEFSPRGGRRQLADDHLCEGFPPEACPFMLRMWDDDPLPRIADDALQHIWEVGEDDLSLNSAFFWHDVRSFQHAMGRLKRFLLLTQACEDLLALLDPREIKNKTQIRVRV